MELQHVNMINKFYILFLFQFLANCGTSQEETLECLKNNFFVQTRFDDGSGRYYASEGIYGGKQYFFTNDSMSLSVSGDSLDIYKWKRLYLVGYVNDLISTKEDFIPNGKYFATYDLTLSPKSKRVVAGGILCDGEELFINKPPSFYSTNLIDYGVYTYLYVESQAECRDYFNEFLNKDVKAVCALEIDVYDSFEGEKVGYLVDKDLVEILEEQEGWAKIKYLKTQKEYWIYNSCLE